MARRKNYGIKKFVKRGVRAAGKYLKKRYVSKGKGPMYQRVKYAKLANDVYRIQRSLNSERKYKDNSWFGVDVGAVNYNSAGYHLYDITTQQAPVQGDGYNERVGRQIKLTGMTINYQTTQMSAATQANLIKVEFWQILGDNETVDNTLLLKIYENSTISTVIDMNSKRNPDYMHAYKCVGRKYIKIAADNYSGISNYNNGVWNLRFNNKLKFVDDSTTVATGQIFMVVFCRTGNANVSNASSVSGNQFNAANTGASIQVFGRLWYSDT